MNITMYRLSYLTQIYTQVVGAATLTDDNAAIGTKSVSPVR